jgi:arsenate reductase
MSVKKILFLCVRNSARSQLAEGLARAMAPPGYEFLSAGSDPGSLNPFAVLVMDEIGIDIAGQRAKPISSIPLDSVDVIVTLCAEEICPVVPGQMRRLHWPLPDPAATDGPIENRIAAFRTTRDRLRERLPELWR